MSKSVYEMVTDRIIEQLEQGCIPWQRPWTGVQSDAYNIVSKRPYSLLNQMLLKHTGSYGTFKQWQELGGHIRKGEKSEIIVFWKIYPIEEAERIKEEYKTREHIEIREIVSNKAFYSPSGDYIQVPCKEQYTAIEEFYSTLFHEMVHSTGHKTRLDRLETGSNAHFGSETYSKEELTAELGSASLLNMLGIETPKTFRNSSAYIQSWLQVLRNDCKFIVSASSKAEKAVNYILGKEA
jgi:antirestriction protein ArdC